jgi:3-amino-4-hydroxybenzoic acid synthase
MRTEKLCWLDIRGEGAQTAAVVEEAIHQRVDGIAADDPAALANIPPAIRRVLIPTATFPDDIGAADVLIVRGTVADRAALADIYPDVEVGRYMEIVDADTLQQACDAARTERWCVLEFRESTKIPLEIVIAAAAGASGSMVTVAADVPEAEVIFGVLEHGSDGVLMPARAVGDATALRRAASGPVGKLPLAELEVVATAPAGMGDRACVDTCTYLRRDEGILVGSYSKGMMLCVSETHPLPYMPTRPFRVNAGAIHSYTVGPSGRTQYLSELRAGSKLLAVDVHGGTRPVTVGRVKIETRPLLRVDAVGPDGQDVNLILQDDWHVRVLGPFGAVLNSTELKRGDRIMGYLPTADRHVGYPIDEFCIEQ